MGRKLLTLCGSVALVMLGACDEKIPGTCSDDEECTTEAWCYKGICVWFDPDGGDLVRDDAGDAEPNLGGADAGTDAGLDAGPNLGGADAGTDAGLDAGPNLGGADAGTDAGLDAGTDAAVTCSGSSEACDGVCVDTASNVQHCGRCRHACGENSTCSDGLCSPMTVRTGLVNVSGFDVSDDGVFFASEGALFLCPLGGCKVTPTQISAGFLNIDRVSPLSGAGQVAFAGLKPIPGSPRDKNRLGVYICPISGCAGVPVAAWSNDIGYSPKLEWLSGVGPTLFLYTSELAPSGDGWVGIIARCWNSICSTTSERIEITRTAAASGGPPCLAADAERVYFASGQGALLSCANDTVCSMPRSLLASFSSSKLLARAGNLYWLQKSPISSSIVRCAPSDCSGTRSTIIETSAILDFDVDEIGIYFIGASSNRPIGLSMCSLPNCVGGPRQIAAGLSLTASSLRLMKGFAYWIGVDPADGARQAIWRVAE
jgi:hypothetical protein